MNTCTYEKEAQGEKTSSNKKVLNNHVLQMLLNLLFNFDDKSAPMHSKAH